jgi:hypothetical protein
VLFDKKNYMHYSITHSYILKPLFAHLQKRCLLLTVFLFFALVVTSSAQSPETIVGKWKGEAKHDREIEFYLSKDGLYYGKTIGTGTKKSDKGHLLLRKLVYVSEEKVFRGIMSPPDRNAEINATLSFSTPNRLKVVGHKMFMTKTIYFIRAN